MSETLSKADYRAARRAERTAAKAARREAPGPVTTPMRTPGWTQETIVGSTADAYLETLEQMLLAAEPRARNDPTLAIALSIEMLGLLVREVRASRSAASRLGERIT